ncbi:MAG: mechanosensitive ion channel [Myxococcales bacterium]|nr:mechanosensitive ion channel [Myxococcales bacterium]
MKRFRAHAPHSLLAATAALLLPSVATAQDLDVESLKEIARLIRWGGAASSVLVVFAAWLALRFLRSTVERLSQQFVQWRLWLHQAETIAQFLVYVVTFIAVLMLSFRLDSRTLTVIGGGLAVSFGFAIKDLVASVVSGVVIMIDRPFQVGDRVLFEGEYGDVISIGLRSVRIRTLDDNTVTVPNSKFLSERISCANYGELDMQVVMGFHVGLDQDISLARQLVHDAAISSRFIHLPKPVVVLVEQVVNDSYMAVRLTLKAYVLDTQHENAFKTDVNLRVLDAFRDRGISPPQILVHTRTQT